MILESPSDVARELARHPGREYDLKVANNPTLRLYATHTGSFTIWKATASRPLVGLVNLTEFELGPGPYHLSPV